MSSALGAPKAKISVYLDDILLERAKVTGVHSFDRQYTAPGAYNVCAKYPWPRPSTDPGSTS